MDEGQHHHHQAPSGPPSATPGDVRQSHVFADYPQQYPGSHSAPTGMPPMHGGMGASQGPIAAGRRSSLDDNDDAVAEGLFPDIPEAKKRKFILVEDSKRQCRLRVRVTLEGVNTKEIPDSFRKSASVFPRSYFPREMQSPPPSATGSRFFQEDFDDGVEVEGGRAPGARGSASRETSMVKVPLSDGHNGEVAVPRLRKTSRGREVRLNDLGYRMAWLQSRVFAGRTVFLQRACKFPTLVSC